MLYLPCATLHNLSRSYTKELHRAFSQRYAVESENIDHELFKFQLIYVYRPSIQHQKQNLRNHDFQHQRNGEHQRETKVRDVVLGP